MSDHPADNVTAEDVQDHVEVKVSPLGWAKQLGDIPGPDLVRRGGQEFGLGISWVTELIAAFTDGGLIAEDAIHSGDRAEVVALVEQSGPDLSRGVVNESLTGKGVNNCGAFGWLESAARFSPRPLCQ